MRPLPLPKTWGETYDLVLPSRYPLHPATKIKGHDCRKYPRFRPPSSRTRKPPSGQPPKLPSKPSYASRLSQSNDQNQSEEQRRSPPTTWAVSSHAFGLGDYGSPRARVIGVYFGRAGDCLRAREKMRTSIREPMHDKDVLIGDGPWPVQRRELPAHLAGNRGGFASGAGNDWPELRVSQRYLVMVSSLRSSPMAFFISAVERASKIVEAGSEREEGRVESPANKTEELNPGCAESELVGEVERVVLVLLDGGNLDANG
ncbi:hypothetical protein QBC47DRAFT_462039 [Echria macrotheca]|uniref:Uncharacterized protein n=1 Tax=Echria macrotheca TaxID=438768 RepID=A0AAJ0F532_9PEZI|nr:hypothetical protein QBC47DRAFT_462039 [Echria macrotheca]